MLRLPPRKMCYRGVPSWRKHTILEDNLSNLAEAALDHTVFFGMASSKRILSFRLFCSVRKNNLQVARKKLYHESKWASLFCPTCNRSSTAKKWLCGCMPSSCHHRVCMQDVQERATGHVGGASLCTASQRQNICCAVEGANVCYS